MRLRGKRTKVCIELEEENTSLAYFLRILCLIVSLSSTLENHLHSLMLHFPVFVQTGYY